MARTKQTSKRAQRRTSHKQLATERRVSTNLVSSTDDEWSCNEEYVMKSEKQSTKKMKFRKKMSIHKKTTRPVGKTTQNGERNPNKIVSFIQLSRKVLHCNPSQLKQLMSQMIDIFDAKDEYHALRNMLLIGFKAKYKDIPLAIYERIEAIDDMQPKLLFNDSFPNDDDSEDEDEEIENMNNHYNKDKAFLIKIPKDVLSYCFNFTEITDIKSVSKTCRYLVNVAYDANSIYHLTFGRHLLGNIMHIITDARYSKIKSLTLLPYHRKHQNEDTLIEMCRIWNKLESLKVMATSLTFALLERCFPSPLELKRLTIEFQRLTYLDRIDSRMFIEMHINHQSLQHLCLKRMIVSLENIETLMCLSNLKTLSLTASPRESDAAVGLEDFNAFLLSNKQYIGEQFPFPHLQEIETDSSLLLDHNIDLLNWLLMNGSNRKSLTLDINSNTQPQLERDTRSRFIVSLSHVSDLYITLSVDKSIFPLNIMANLFKWRYFALRSLHDIQDRKIQKVVDSLVANSESSKLVCRVDTLDAFKAWTQEHYRAKTPFFGCIEIEFPNSTNVNNFDESVDNFDDECNNPDCRYEPCLNEECSCVAKRAIRQEIISEFKAIEWFLNRGDNKEKLKQIGINRMSLDIKHKHKIKMTPRREAYEYVNCMIEDVCSWELERIEQERANQIKKVWKDNLMKSSKRSINEYVTKKFESLSKRKKFRFDQSNHAFSFKYEIKC